MLGLRAVTSVARIPSNKNASLFFQCYNLTLEMADLFVTASYLNDAGFHNCVVLIEERVEE
jgi:hypothetical protein